MPVASAQSATTKVKPLHDKILVRRLEAEEKTKGGIVLPDTAKEKPREGVVLAVGEGKVTEEGKRLPISVKKNDRILFSSYAGTEIRMNGEDLLILAEDDVLGVIES